MFKDFLNDYFDGKKLVFAYIPYYRCLYDVNLNFDPEFSIAYDYDSRRLAIKKNTSFPDNFWPNNISGVSVIAGKNGAGKTSVIQWLQERIFLGGMPERIQGIIAIYENYRLTVYHDIEIANDDSSEFEKDGIILKFINTWGWHPEAIRSSISIKSLFYSGHFNFTLPDRRLIDEDDMIWNISDQWMMVEDCKSGPYAFSNSLNLQVSDILKIYEGQNRLRICKLLLDDRFQETFQENGKPGLRLPRYIVFTPLPGVDSLPSVTNRKHSKKDIRVLTEIKNVRPNSMMQMLDQSEGKTGITEMLYQALSNFCFQIVDRRLFGDSLTSVVIGIFTNDYVQSGLSSLEWVKELNFKIAAKIHDMEGEVSKNDRRQVVDFFESLEKTMVFLNKLRWKDGYAFIDCVSIIKDPGFNPTPGLQIYADIYPTRILNDFKKITQMERFCMISFSHTLEQSSALSSGEFAMLNLYSRIKYAFDYDSSHTYDGDSCLLFLDEAEIGFHPEWQRQFVNKLTQFISRFDQRNLRFQIIYTTHSPITLSDMPKECVNLLKSDNGFTTNESETNKKETFGANVFELYGDSFFMKNGLIGEFASEKIRALSSEIDGLIQGLEQNKRQNEQEGEFLIGAPGRIGKLRDAINMIGDKRIKAYLHSRLDIVDPTEEIKRLKERIAILEANLDSRHEKD